MLDVTANFMDAWKQRAAAGMLQDLERSGIDEDLEQLRAGWATNSSAAAQCRGGAGRGPFEGCDFMDESSELNRRGDVAMRRLRTVRGLREVATQSPSQQPAAGMLRLTNSPMPGAASSSNMFPQRTRTTSFGSGDIRRSSAHTVNTAYFGWRGPVDPESDDDHHSCQLALDIVPQLRRSPTWRSSRCTSNAESADPWDSWERRWAETFRMFEEAEQMKHRAKMGTRGADDEDCLSEAADKLRQEEIRRQREKRKTRAPHQSATPHESTKAADGASSRNPRNTSEGSSPKSDFSGGAGSHRPANKMKAPAMSAVARFATFDEYEKAWLTFEGNLKGNQPISYTDIPWPLCLPTISGATSSDSAGENKKKMRQALLRWHPDKWAPVLDRVREVDRTQVADQVKEVTRRILSEKEKFGG